MADNAYAISTIAETIQEVGEAKALLVIGQQSQAEYLLEMGIQKHPAHCDAWHALGHACRQQGKQNEALAAYGKAIDIAYRYHSIIHFECSAQRLQRALLYYSMSEKAKADEDIEQAIFQDHNNEAALLIQQQGWSRGMDLPEYNSNIMTEVGCQTELERRNVSFEELSPHQQAHDKAIYYWRHGNHDHAIGLMSETLKTRKDYSMGWHHRALMFLELNDPRQAMGDLEKALNCGVDWHQNYHYGAALHHFHRGMLYHEMRQNDMAMIDVSKALDIDRNLADAYAVRASLRAEMQQIPTAIADIEHALSLEANDNWQQMRADWIKQIGG